jgi:hypothetical protein
MGLFSVFNDPICLVLTGTLLICLVQVAGLLQ